MSIRHEAHQYLGAHMSIAGGLHRAFERIREVNGTALQIFTRNQRQWMVPELTDEEVLAFARAWKRWGAFPVAAHDSYLINLAGSDEAVVERSMAAFVQEIRRCERLRLPYLILHPCAHTGQGADKGIRQLAGNLDRCLTLSESTRVTLLLETTAGQGTALGGSFDELQRILERVRAGSRLGVCFDTCHVFAAGYDLRSRESYEATMSAFDRLIGCERIAFFHLNDAKSELGSHLDRHAHIGQGRIGRNGFWYLLNDPRFVHVPKVLETPKGKDLAEDKSNLRILRSLME